MHTRIDHPVPLTVTGLLTVLFGTIAEWEAHRPEHVAEPPQPVLVLQVADDPIASQELPDATLPPPRGPTLDEILLALRVVETGGEPRNGRDAVGDGGLAIGPFQIHRAYWEDSGLSGGFGDCREPEYARAVVVAYWQRYCPEALRELDAEILARTHNGGPRGSSKAATGRFWRRVERELGR